MDTSILGNSFKIVHFLRETLCWEILLIHFFAFLLNFSLKRTNFDNNASKSSVLWIKDFICEMLTSWVVPCNKSPTWVRLWLHCCRGESRVARCPRLVSSAALRQALGWLPQSDSRGMQRGIAEALHSGRPGLRGHRACKLASAGVFIWFFEFWQALIFILLFSEFFFRSWYNF